ncbi:gas vesicle protein GvpO [Pseudonocardia sp. CA-107938]|uniref:gas vesicle protein GvpO n=1 Tax=Pseudonocardia sp. CA-107938 TaxID=3240021 RepID=UPI003D93B1CA
MAEEQDESADDSSESSAEKSTEEKPKPRTSRPRRTSRTRSSSNGSRPPADVAARDAARQVLTLTGRELEGVVAVERGDDSWRVCVEVVESRRIPDSADILAVYEVETDDHGELRRLARVHRYARGQLGRGGR